MRWLDKLNNIVSFCETLSRKVLDDNGKKNIHDASAAGLETRVVRSYDDVGLHDGKDECKWCKSREGDWSYREAVRNGVFERHPGCECTIDYVTSRGTQRQTNWRDNTWEDVQDPDTLKMRQKNGSRDTPSNEGRWLKLARDGNTFVVKNEDLYGNSRKIKLIKGFTDIVGHGDPYSMVFRDSNGDETNVSAVEFEKILKKGGFYKGGNIRLIACKTGKEPAVVAHYLADKYGVLVTAPTETVNVDFDGNMLLADDEKNVTLGIETGEWVIIKPRWMK